MMVVILFPLYPLETLLTSPWFEATSQSGCEALEAALLLASFFSVEGLVLDWGEADLPLASLAKRTSVAKSGEEAVPGDLKIERFWLELASSMAASSTVVSAVLWTVDLPSMPTAFRGLSLDSLLAAESVLTVVLA
jgi:hypothetical protein